MLHNEYMLGSEPEQLLITAPRGRPPRGDEVKCLQGARDAQTVLKTAEEKSKQQKSKSPGKTSPIAQPMGVVDAA